MTTLTERVAEALALDGKRTPGEWKVGERYRTDTDADWESTEVNFPAHGAAVLVNSIGEGPPFAKADYERQAADAAFIAAGPAHIALIRDLFAALQAAEKDAARYRWLRRFCDDSLQIPIGGWPNPGTPVASVIGLNSQRQRYPMSVTGEELDSAIDAAIAREPPND